MAKLFEQPYHQLVAQDQFGANEVGITHPNRPSFVRLSDNGDIEISSGEGLAIVMSPSNKSITFVADTIKFLTKADGLRWNDMEFNSGATTFTESTLHPQVADATKGLYRGTDYYLKD